ncbi:MAG: SdrD B-like domain-containing protein, partial [Bacteroidota bacterium]
MNIFHTIIRRILVLACALGALQGYGQGYFKTYPATNGNANDAALTADGGYLMAGVFQNGGIQKTAANGNVLWSTPNAFGDGSGIAVCNTADGGCVAVGEDYTGAGGRKNIVVRTDAAGAKQWETVLPNFQLPNGIKSIAATPDGQFIACGVTRDAQLKQQIWLVKLDGNGNIVWNKALGDNNLSEQIARMIPTSDGYFAVVGDVLNIGNNRDLFLAKVDAGGNLLWEKFYPKPLYQVAKDLVETSDGGLVILGDNLQSNPSALALLKVDAQGNELWFEHLNVPPPFTSQIPFSAALCITRDQNDNLYLPIHTGFAGPTESILYLAQLNGIGQLVDYFQLSSTEFVRRIYLTNDNFLAFLGGNASTQAFLLKTDLEGQLYSSQISGSIFDDQNANCTQDSGENGFEDYKIEALSSTGETFYAKTNINGAYNLRVSSGDYQVIVHPKNNIAAFGAPCDTPTVSITSVGQVENLPAIGIYASAHCPLMTVSMFGSRFRRCLPNYVTVQYCNEGNEPAQNVSVQLLKDPLLNYLNSSVP